MSYTRFIILFLLMLSFEQLLAQDPNFSQFFASPLTINPANTASSDATWRGFINYKQQWLGPSAPYNTATLSFDTKILKKHTGDNTLGIGTMLMVDNTFGGILKSNYGGISLAYHQQIGGDATSESSIGFGFGAIYGNKQLNFTELNFESQFVSYGFNTNLPTGENGLFSMQPFISVNTGILYSLSTDKYNFDLGGSVFHFNKPKQSFLKDELQVIPARYVVHSSFDYSLDNDVIINLNAMYQQQSSLNYWVVGGTVNKPIDNDATKTIHFGIWYRNRDAIFPYIGYGINNLQLGLSYDITVSKLNQAPKPPSSWELSVSYKVKDDENATSRSRLRCPWK